MLEHDGGIVNDQVWPIVVSIVGVVGFWLAGKRVWWSWWLNLANQALWTVLAVVTQQWGFFIGIVIYTPIFLRNAIVWTREHGQDKTYVRIANRDRPTVIPSSPEVRKLSCLYMHENVHRDESGIRRCTHQGCSGFNSAYLSKRTS